MPVLGPSHTCRDPACPALPTGRPLPTSRVTHRGTGNVSLSVALLRPSGNLEAPVGESGSPPRPLRPSSGRNPHSYGNFCPNWNWRGQRPLQLRAGQGRVGPGQVLTAGRLPKTAPSGPLRWALGLGHRRVTWRESVRPNTGLGDQEPRHGQRGARLHKPGWCLQ